MTMDRDSLRNDLKASLHDAVDAFTDPDDFNRLLDKAAQDLPRRRSLVLTGTLTLKADTAEYDSVPGDMVRPLFTRYANSERLTRSPWAKNYPPPRPKVHLVNSGTPKLLVMPKLSAVELAEFGDTLEYDYTATYTISATEADTTVKPEDRWLLLLRAQAEAMRELAMRNVNKPVRLGAEGAPAANGTPAGLHERFMKEFLAA